MAIVDLNHKFDLVFDFFSIFFANNRNPSKLRKKCIK